ncbi:MAG: hypothetical protein A3I66_23080 [Burkholderiales bacterium RIFCSPLOWO2_02_FULL_57_36]|nr:MAG: hypothetical protein A3I66_23080 [Burkholderiales bacterium RIFCSPLOWO2_02_FULL_57_36]
MKTDGKPFQVRTDKPVKNDAVPRMPHEHDESQDSQESEERHVIKQAYADIMSGQVDTDMREQRGVEETVKDQLKTKTPGQSVIVPKTKTGKT